MRKSDMQKTIEELQHRLDIVTEEKRIIIEGLQNNELCRFCYPFKEKDRKIVSSWSLRYRHEDQFPLEECEQILIEAPSSE